jgi:hypothetical protein
MMMMKIPKRVHISVIKVLGIKPESKDSIFQHTQALIHYVDVNTSILVANKNCGADNLTIDTRESLTLSLN